MDVRGAAKLVQTTATNIGSGVQSVGKGLGRKWTQISDKVSGSVGKAIAAAKEHFGPKAETKHAEISIGSPFNVVPQRSNLGSEGTQQAKAPTEPKTLSEKQKGLEQSIKDAEKELFDFEEEYRHKEKGPDYQEYQNRLSTDVGNLKDQLADIKE